MMVEYNYSTTLDTGKGGGRTRIHVSYKGMGVKC